jgi:hypothetical protein
MPISETFTALGKGIGFGQAGSPTFGAKPIEVKIENKSEETVQSGSNFFQNNKTLLIASIILVIAFGSYYILKKKGRKNG